MPADQLALFWILGFASAVAVFHCIGLARPAPPMETERRSSLPRDRSLHTVNGQPEVVRDADGRPAPFESFPRLSECD
jgi:hypothetical protein